MKFMWRSFQQIPIHHQDSKKTEIFKWESDKTPVVTYVPGLEMYPFLWSVRYWEMYVLADPTVL